MKLKKILFALLILVVAIASLSSCEFLESLSEPQNADSLVGRIERKMDRLKGYRMNLTGEFVFDYSGNTVEVVSEGVGVTVARSTGGYYFYLSQSVTAKIKSLNVEEKTETLTAYKDGYVYLKNSTDGDELKVYGALSEDKFVEYWVKADSDFASALMAGNKEFKKNEDSSWTIVCSDYSDEEIAKITEEYGLGGLGFGDVEDVRIEINADGDYVAKNIKMEIILDDDEEKEDDVSMQILIEYVDINSAKEIEFSTEDYIRTGNIEYMKILSQKLKEKNNDENGLVKLDVENKDYRGNTTSESDVIEYGTKNGEYFFDIDAKTKNQTVEIEYNDGKLTTKSGNSKNWEEISDYEAKEFIAGLINSARYDDSRVRNVYKMDDNTYKYTLVGDASKYNTQFAITKMDHVIIVKYEKGEIDTMECTVKLYSNLSENPTLEIKTTVDFNYRAEENAD